MPVISNFPSGGGGSGMKLSRVEVVAADGGIKKTGYLDGEVFDRSTIVVKPYYTVSGVETTFGPATDYDIEPAVLTAETTKVTVICGSKSAEITGIQVLPRLLRLEVSQNPTKDHRFGDTFDSTGLRVDAVYSKDGGVGIVTETETLSSGFTTDKDGVAFNGITIAAPSLSINVPVTVSYTKAYANGHAADTKIVVFQLPVGRKRVTKPTWKGASDFKYANAQKDANNTSLWNDYNTSYMTISGTTTGTLVNSYNAKFTPKDNYCWPDDSIDEITVAWNIPKAEITVTFSETEVTIGGGANQTKTVAITYTPNVYDGTPTMNRSGTIAGLTSYALTKNQFTATGDGSTVIDPGQAFVLSFAETANCTITPASQTITVKARYWEWGAQPTETAGSTDGVGDADWWAGLKNWAAGATATERAACVGKTKRVTLSSAVAGFNKAIMVCIGADQDGVGTLTFQTKYCSPTPAAFDGSSAIWRDSTARTTCESFATQCSASGSIKQITKLTSDGQGSRTNAANIETDNKGWLPSEQEMGLNSYSPSAQEGTKGLTAHMGYNYYKSNTERTKHVADANGNNSGSTGWYWERSRQYNGAYFVCYVYTNGTANRNGYNDRDGRLAPAFVIG